MAVSRRGFLLGSAGAAIAGSAVTEVVAKDVEPQLFDGGMTFHDFRADFRSWSPEDCAWPVRDENGLYKPGTRGDA